jgi:hypothetical protein
MRLKSECELVTLSLIERNGHHLGSFASVRQESYNFGVDERAIVNLDRDLEDSASDNLGSKMVGFENTELLACLSLNVRFTQIEELNIVCLRCLKGTMTAAHHL